ncbi:hypothetical protein PSN45_001980 [Yamadazyma tenuis]|uniref:Tubulin-folding cofactor D ARM repeats domain-containing protein n=1 Tax=Candida tenuis (strain ATCC 10573 / BCRC 21748 / CBS 615 / JCM 9827 / NBRC 10315 / NRRL Y-1498 / VKM Y-70) TaxID=590646 RepID=G3BD83_CANTC|nr:uncharacterized protein CANTEDRAFT_136750 [Yamadazyma tenuis ATCC 10573]EGV60263.1 hypothetical protein CANTEDRAFT_136750 [Yamadazyma tenuis ATCC 10573]WEJ94494.1 hypothetical protein PSN45_001980 [Yamadazyma tenuis]
MELDEYESDDLLNALSRQSDQLILQITNKVQRLPLDHSHIVVDSIVNLINEFEMGPNLLDSVLTPIIESLIQFYINEWDKTNFPNEMTRAIGVVVYNLAKVRGFKPISNFFPSDVYMVIKILAMLQRNDLDENETFFNLLWLTNLVLVPFSFEKHMINNFFDISLFHLKKHSNGSKNQQCSSILMSRFLSRPDLIQLGYLDEYLCGLFENWDETIESEKLGHFMVINKLLKICPKSSILTYTNKIYDQIIQLELMNLKIGRMNKLNLSFIIKILCKLAEDFAAENQYSLIEKIMDNLINDVLKFFNESLETNLRYKLSKSLSGISKSLVRVVNYHEQILIYLIQQLDLSIDISEPSDYSSISMSTFLDVDIDFDQISIATYHTILLYLGYMALNRILPLHIYPAALSIVHKTLFTHQRRYSNNVGNQLKDSSCFILWSIMKSLSTSDYEQLESTNPTMFMQLFIDLIEVSIFDKDLIIRRCGVSVLQEVVGRIGNRLIKTEDRMLKGQQTILFVEIFASNNVSTVSESFKSLDKLLGMGLDKGLLVEMIIRNILKNDDDFEYQKLLSSKLIQFMKTSSEANLPLSISRPVPDYMAISNTFAEMNHSLYLQSELWRNFEDTNEHTKIVDIKDFSDGKAEDFIEFVAYRCNAGCVDDLEHFFEKIVHTKRDTSDRLVKLFTLMSKKRIGISDNVFKTVAHYLPASFTKSIFYLETLTQPQIQRLLLIVHSAHLDYEIRFNLIVCLHKVYSSSKLINANQLNHLIELLNDYTTTEQGDVGSKIREALLNFIQDFLPAFIASASTLTESLWRISGEPIGKLRTKAFSILLKLNGVDFSLETMSEYSYYKHLFQFYDSNASTQEEVTQFWKGIILSIGGLTGETTNIKASFKQFILYLDMKDQDGKNSIFKEILSLITKKNIESQKTLKEYMHGLNLMVKMFESNSYVPTEYLSSLYVKAYNLQINCSNLIRIKLSLRVMMWLCIQGQDKKTATISIKRIINVIKTHRVSPIRTYCMELFYEILLERHDPKHEELETLDIDDKQSVDHITKYLLTLYT